ncbi:MAG: 23S rRNA (adenine(2503)-C(2))-methyltransferase RlmN [Hydrogenobaculum sp.]|nr:23S rRNA (adenine(2503)-C(2))-methyltransferase RlmN [Hydrogenobaculum sp.]
MINLLEDYFELQEKLNLEKYRISQIKSWAFKKKITNVELMTDIPKSLRQELKIDFHVLSLDSFVEGEDSTKFVFKTKDGHLIESVLIKEKDHYTLCISTQIGCAVGCKFCVSTIGGLLRNLSFSEIVDQYFYISILRNIFIRNIVFMGMGEPLANFENLKKASFIFLKEFELSKRHITISTSAYTNYLKKLKNDDFLNKLNLAISLNASDDETRKSLMPNVIGSLKELFEILKTYPLEPRRRITIEYVLIKDVNSSLKDAKNLVNLLKNLKHKIKVNLIPYNESPILPFERPSESDIYRFQQELLKNDISCTIRWSKGLELAAACGHLSRIRTFDMINI